MHRKKLDPVGTILILGRKVKPGSSVICLYLKINLSITTSMKRFWLELSIDMVTVKSVISRSVVSPTRLYVQLV